MTLQTYYSTVQTEAATLTQSLAPYKALLTGEIISPDVLADLLQLVTLRLERLSSIELPASTRKAPKATAPTTTVGMSDRELYAYYKKHAIVNDLAFFIANLDETTSDELKTAAEALQQTGKATRADVTRLNYRWGCEKAEYDRLHDIPAIGSERWRDLQDVYDAADWLGNTPYLQPCPYPQPETYSEANTL